LCVCVREREIGESVRMRERERERKREIEKRGGEEKREKGRKGQGERRQRAKKSAVRAHTQTNIHTYTHDIRLSRKEPQFGQYRLGTLRLSLIHLRHRLSLIHLRVFPRQWLHHKKGKICGRHVCVCGGVGDVVYVCVCVCMFKGMCG